jgi:hypothetical protein
MRASASVFLAGLSLMVLVITACTPSHEETQLEKVFDLVQAQRLVPDSLYQFRVDLDLPIHLTETPPGSPVERGEGRGHIWAFESAGLLHLFVETEDNGHAGSKGWARTSDCGIPAWKEDEWGERWRIQHRPMGCWHQISTYLMD